MRRLDPVRRLLGLAACLSVGACSLSDLDNLAGEPQASGGRGGASGRGAASATGGAGAGRGGAGGAGGGAASGGASGKSGGGVAGAAGGLAGASPGGASGAGAVAGLGGAAGAVATGGTAGKPGAAGASGVGGSGGSGPGGGFGGKSGQSGSGGLSGSGGSIGPAGSAGGPGGSGNGASAGSSGSGGDPSGAGSGGDAGTSGAGASAGASAGSGGGGQSGAAGSGGGAPCDLKADPDCDGVRDKEKDNCPGVANAPQSDQDRDDYGDACDPTPGGPDATTQLGMCGADAGKPAIVLKSVTSPVCPGGNILLVYESGGDLDCGSPYTARIYSAGGGNENGTPLGTTASISGTVIFTLPDNLAPGTHYVELQTPTVASERLPVVIGGAGAMLGISGPRTTLLESGAVSYVLTAALGSGAKLTLDGAEIATFSGPSATVPVTFGSAGLHSLVLRGVAPDGCNVTVKRNVKVLTCNPVLPATTITTLSDPEADASQPLLVCGGTSYAGTPGNAVYVLPEGTVTLGGVGVLWLMPGATLAAGSSGIWDVLHVGAPPPSPGGSYEFFQCPSMSFDRTAVAKECP